MPGKKLYDVIIIGGSYAGLSAALTLSRMRKNVLVIDNDNASNKTSSTMHNLITHENDNPATLRKVAKKEILKYPGTTFLMDIAQKLHKTGHRFTITTISRKKFQSKKVLFCTGVADIMPGIAGFAECWAKTILHCPYCHGYELKGQKMAIIANGEHAYHLCVLLSNLTKNITLLCNGVCTLPRVKVTELRKNNIAIIETSIVEIIHDKGRMQQIVFKDGSRQKYAVAFAKVLLKQQCEIPEKIGCKFTEHLITVDDCMRTSVDGVYAAGDNCFLPRSLSIVIGAGTAAAFHISWDLSRQEFAENTQGTL